MEISIRLATILGLDPGGDKHLSHVARDVGLSRQQLRHLIDPMAKTINREHLAKVSQWLIERGDVLPSDLINEVFVISPDEFWKLMGGQREIEICMGVRPDEKWGDYVVIAADSRLQSMLLYQLTGPHRVTRKRSGTRHSTFKPHLLDAWPRERESDVDAAVMKSATNFYSGFGARNPRDAALLGLGSVKSNPVIEQIVGGSFKAAKPFMSQDSVTFEWERTCPFMLKYRETDPHPPSCHGGQQLSQKNRDGGPGIYYEMKRNASWHFAPIGDNDDVAYIFYRHEKLRARTYVALGGFSGRSTRCLAEYLEAKGANEFWPPAVSNQEVDMGLFIVKFKLRPRKRPNNMFERQSVKPPQIFKIPTDVLESRLV